MIPIRKISETILDYGNPVFQSLPSNPTKVQFEELARIVVCAWNAVILDEWNKTDKYQASLLSTSEKVEGLQLIIKRLIKRKKKKFSEDMRGVGHYEAIDRNGKLTFRAEARGDIEHMKAYEVVQ